MTRSRHITQAARRRTKDRTAAAAAPAQAPIKFLIFEDNGGAYHWAIITASGDRLVQSASFASYEQAKQAAGIVRRGAGSARFEDRTGDTHPLELAPPLKLAPPPSSPPARRRRRCETISMQSVGWMKAAASAARR